MFSIVICAHNPSPEVFSKVLNSLENLRKDELEEIVIVDNNSSPALEELDYVLSFQDNLKGKSRIVKESKPGLTFARIKGVKETTSPYICFVDDDNVLDSNYLVELQKLFEQYPILGCVGPGNVNVEFTAEVEGWVKNYLGLFQQKSKKSFEYGCAKGWHSFSPAGTGLTVSRKVLTKYIELIETGNLNAGDRSGKSLASGGDSQIIHVATLLSLCSGQAPQLKLVHLIKKEKANLNYMKNLVFMVNQSIYVHHEVFPELKNTLVEIPGRMEFVSFFWSLLVKSKFKVKSPKFVIPMADRLGIIQGSYQILKINRLPFLFRWSKKIIGIND